MTLRELVCLSALVLVAASCGPHVGGSTPQNAPAEQRPSGQTTLALADVAEPPPVVELDRWGDGAVNSHSSTPLTGAGKLPSLTIAGDDETSLPLEHTHIKANLLGFVAEVEVHQTYANPHDTPIEVTYVFPLPDNSAVSAMKMQIGERVIAAKIRKRKDAQRIYQSARRAGRTAALLEQERPNIFTQSVANIAPGEKVDVVIHYVQDLSYDGGEYEFVFPLVVAPRFIPKEPTPAPHGSTPHGPTPGESAAGGSPNAAPVDEKGKGTYADTNAVVDASRITPPVLAAGQRSGHDISLEVVAQHTFAIQHLSVPSHKVAKRQPADGSLHVTLAGGDTIANRDFLMRYRVAKKEPLATLLTSSAGKDGYFALLLHPPALNVDKLVGARELIFVVDVSGSMWGAPLGLAKTAMRSAIEQLRPHDTFNILTFAGRTAKSFKAPRRATRSNVERALNFLEQARAGGGTHMANAVNAALSPAVLSGRHRYVFFLTDGLVGNEAAIIGGASKLVNRLEEQGQRARVFGFGVGSSPNRHLLEQLARAGKGVSVYASNRQDPRRAVNQFYRYIDRAVLTDVTVDWGNFATAEIYPQPLGDLFASRPIIVHGRYSGSADVPVTVRARRGEQAVVIPVRTRRVTHGGPRGGMLGSLWARSKIHSLQEQMWINERSKARAEITQIGLDFGLVTAFTSFVAVDESRIVGNGKPKSVMQPVEVPEGINGAAAGARATYKPHGASLRSHRGVAERRSVNSEMYAVQQVSRPGCYCNAQPASSRRYGWLSLAGMVVLAWRRRRRDGRRS